MEHTMNLASGPFEKIKSGNKTIELRLYDEKRKLISVGDTIEFVNIDDINDKIKVKVTALHIFGDFEELYKSLPLLKCGYDALGIKTAKASDMNEYYPIEKQNKYGVVGIEIVLS